MLPLNIKYSVKYLYLPISFKIKKKKKLKSIEIIKL